MRPALCLVCSVPVKTRSWEAGFQAAAGERVWNQVLSDVAGLRGQGVMPSVWPLPCAIWGADMVGRISMLAALGGAASAHWLPDTPKPFVWAATASALGGVTLMWLLVRGRGCFGPALSRKCAGWTLLPAWAFLAGLMWVSIQTDSRLSDSLADADIDKVSRVVLRIDSLVRIYPGSRRFEAEVLESKPPGIPRRIMVSWHSGKYAGPYRQASEGPDSFPELVPGQVWRMSLNLRPAHGTLNPHGFDYEGHLFAQGVRATGTVRGTPRFIRDEPWTSLRVMAERARHEVRKAMAPYVEGTQYGAVLRALAIGDQAGVGAEDWKVFNRTSITHLISISGSHITMIAALGGLLTLWVWKRACLRGKPLAEQVPAQVASCLVALLVAWLYCLLAGWGVPARRTFLMLSVLAAAHLIRLPLGPWRVLLLAAVVVVALDPWALMASGFWLSFGAVAVLLASGTWIGTAVGSDAALRTRWVRGLKAACMLQLTVTVGLMPVLAVLFNEVSVVSPLANAYAIPVVSFVVTPLSLVLAAVALVPGLEGLAQVVAGIALGVLDAMMLPTRWLAGLGLAQIDVAAAPGWATVLSLAGLGLAILPRGVPWRGSGWFLMLPALFWRPESPPNGSWNLLAMDVGQGTAVLVRTARTALLFDTGLRHGPESDVGGRTIVPLLKAKGVRQLDVLVVSHADLDHVGGTRSVLEVGRVKQSYSSFDLVAYLRREADLLGLTGETPPLPQVLTRCQHGTSWTVDGVKFEFLWPLGLPAEYGGASESRQRNAQSCVLRIQGAYHSALLTGDIGVDQEEQLIRLGLEATDVVTAAHHGSRGSSGDAFVSFVEAEHVVAQAGRWNRYGHPHPQVERRWQRAGAQFWRTDLQGAISFRSRPDGLHAEALRQASGRHWHRP